METPPPKHSPAKIQAARQALLDCLALQGRLEVRTLDLEYFPGDYIAWNGVKGGGPRGYGWDSCPIHSEYLLAAQGPAGKVKVRIDRAFKEAIGRLTPKRRDLIRRTLPATVTLVQGDDPWYGKDRILVSEEDLVRWVEEVKALLVPRAGRTPKRTRAANGDPHPLSLLEGLASRFNPPPPGASAGGAP